LIYYHGRTKAVDLFPRTETTYKNHAYRS